jgi:hypothetical protein
MQKRGGGILDITLGIKQIYSNYYQCMRHLKPKTAWSHFINSLPRTICENVKRRSYQLLFFQTVKEIQVIMSILSNYVP